MPKRKNCRASASLADKLRAWRARHKGNAPGGGMSQSEAAHRLGVSPRTLQQWEIDRRKPRGLALSSLLEKIKK